MNLKKWISIAAICLFSSVGTTCIHGKNEPLNKTNPVKTKTTRIKKKSQFKKSIPKKIKTLEEKINTESLDEVMEILNDKTLAPIFLDPEKLDLYDLRDLKGVDLSQKYVIVDVAGAEMALGKEKDKVFSHIKKFYKDFGITLDFHFVGHINKNILNSTKHLGLVFANTPTFKRNPSWYGYAVRTEKTCYNFLLKTFGYYLKASLNLAGTSAGDKLRNERKEIDKVNRMRVGSNVTHELGHLFGLSHTQEFKDDPIEDYLPGEKNSKGRKIPNCMSYKWEVESKKYRLGCGFTEWQKKLMHSYLSGGKVKKGWESVGFYHTRYHKLVSYSSNYNFFPKKK